MQHTVYRVFSLVDVSNSYLWNYVSEAVSKEASIMAPSQLI